MPDDRMPRILAGFRLQRTTTLLFSIFSRGTNFTRPDTICIIKARRQPSHFLQPFTHVHALA